MAMPSTGQWETGGILELRCGRISAPLDSGARPICFGRILKRLLGPRNGIRLSMVRLAFRNGSGSRVSKTGLSLAPGTCFGSSGTMTLKGIIMEAKAICCRETGFARHLTTQDDERPRNQHGYGEGVSQP